MAVADGTSASLKVLHCCRSFLKTCLIPISLKPISRPSSCGLDWATLSLDGPTAVHHCDASSQRSSFETPSYYSLLHWVQGWGVRSNAGGTTSLRQVFSKSRRWRWVSFR